MRDMDIRQAFHDKELSVFGSEPDTLVIDELGLCQGDVRIDIAVINGYLNGYEIKSERDTLERLANQSRIYSEVLDTVTIITSKNHIEKVKKIVPEWWGVVRVQKKGGTICFSTVRPPSINDSVNLFSLAQLLWRDEALGVLEKHNLAKGFKSKPRRYLWQALAEKLTVAQLSQEVRKVIKKRKNWRSDLQQT